jgi:hypothetical protein
LKLKTIYNMLSTLSAGIAPQLLPSLRIRVITARQHLSQCNKAAFHRSPVPCASAAAAPSDDGSKAPPEMRAALRSIRSALRHGRRPAACQGAVQLTAKIVVYGQHQAGQPFAVQLPSVDAAALQPLMDACEPAEAADPGSNKVAMHFGKPAQGCCPTVTAKWHPSGSEQYESCPETMEVLHRLQRGILTVRVQMLDDSNQQVMILPADRFATSFDLAAHDILA